MSAQITGGALARSGSPRRSHNLTLCFQEIFTVIVRLRSNRQAASDAESFRAHLRQALSAAEHQSRSLGYSAEDTRQAVFGVVALLDESILNSTNAVFRDWARRPLQEELFGVHVAGEVFFKSLDRLLARDDSAALADLLEVNYMCLLLGYGGRYSLGAAGDRRHLVDKVGRRLYQIRRRLDDSPTSAAPPDEAQPVSRSDPWVGRLGVAALVCLFVAVAAFAYFWFDLDSGASVLRTLAAPAGIG